VRRIVRVVRGGVPPLGELTPLIQQTLTY